MNMASQFMGYSPDAAHSCPFVFQPEVVVKTVIFFDRFGVYFCNYGMK